MLYRFYCILNQQGKGSLGDTALYKSLTPSVITQIRAAAFIVAVSEDAV